MEYEPYLMPQIGTSQPKAELNYNNRAEGYILGIHIDMITLVDCLIVQLERIEYHYFAIPYIGVEDETRESLITQC